MKREFETGDRVTYAELRGQGAFDWYKFLDGMIKYGATPDEAADALVWADNWVTCASGNQCESIPRYNGKEKHIRDDNYNYIPFEGTPKDAHLAALGCLFYGAIERQDWEEARGILDQIEERSWEIILEMKLGYNPHTFIQLP